MTNIKLTKQLKKMGAICYFLLSSDDVLRLNMSVGDFFDIKIEGIGNVTKMLKLYGSSKVITILKEDFVKYPNLEYDKMYDLIFLDVNQKKTSNDLTKNTNKYKDLVLQVDRLRETVHSFAENEEIEDKEKQQKK